LEGAEEADRAGVGAAQGAFCALNAAEAAFELGRSDVVEQVTADVCARPTGNVIRSFAHHLRGLLSNARGDVAAAEEHARIHREQLSTSAGPELRRYVPDLDAEIALSHRRPDEAWRAAEEASRLATSMVDPAAASRAAAIGVRAQADCAELARARRDDAAERAAVGRAQAILERARVRGADNPALLATVEAEVARAQGRADPERWAAAVRACEARGAAPYSAYARAATAAHRLGLVP
jgi:hypothetical protein